MPQKISASTPLIAALDTDAVPECVRHFGQIVAAIALAVFMTAFVTIPYALERQPGDLAKIQATDEAHHLT